MDEDIQRTYLINQFDLRNSVAMVISSDNWMEHFYLPEISCAESRGQTILVQSGDVSPSYIHYNDNVFKLSKDANAVFKNVNGKWKYVRVDTGKTFTPSINIHLRQLTYTNYII